MSANRPEVFGWNAAIDMSSGDTRVTAIGLSLISTQLDHLIGLLEAKAERDDCCCSIDWDHRCPVHGPQEDDDDDE